MSVLLWPFGPLWGSLIGLVGFGWWITHPKAQRDIDSLVAWHAQSAAYGHIVSLVGVHPSASRFELTRSDGQGSSSTTRGSALPAPASRGASTVPSPAPARRGVQTTG